MEKSETGKSWVLFAGLYVTVIAAIWTYNNLSKPKSAVVTK
jgi:hypothetical protein